MRRGILLAGMAAALAVAAGADDWPPRLVGSFAAPVGRLGRVFEGKFVRWLVSFTAGMAAMVVALGAGLFATKCLPWGRGPEGVLSFVLHFVALAAMVFGGWGTVKAIRG
jgi:hypothetical protein